MTCVICTRVALFCTGVTLELHPCQPIRIEHFFHVYSALNLIYRVVVSTWNCFGIWRFYCDIPVFNRSFLRYWGVQSLPWPLPIQFRYHFCRQESMTTLVCWLFWVVEFLMEGPETIRNTEAPSGLTTNTMRLAQADPAISQSSSVFSSVGLDPVVGKPIKANLWIKVTKSFM